MSYDMGGGREYSRSAADVNDVARGVWASVSQCWRNGGSRSVMNVAISCPHRTVQAAPGGDGFGAPSTLGGRVAGGPNEWDSVGVFPDRLLIAFAVCHVFAPLARGLPKGV
jgi:hypothetical protein